MPSIKREVFFVAACVFGGLAVLCLMRLPSRSVGESLGALVWGTPCAIAAILCAIGSVVAECRDALLRDERRAADKPIILDPQRPTIPQPPPPIVQPIGGDAHLPPVRPLR